MSWLLPPETNNDARVLLATRGVRAFVDGLVTVALPYYLALLGYSDFRIGAITTGTLMGSGALTILLGFRVHTLDRTRLLQAVAIVMMLTGLGFATITSFWPLMIVAVFGTLNPSSGDVSVFLPTEQALLPSTVSDRFRTALYGRYSLIGFTLAAFGSLAAGIPTWVARHKWLSAVNADRGVFVVYSVAGLMVLVMYRNLQVVTKSTGTVQRTALGPSKRLVYRMALVFSIDSLGGGFVLQSLVILWLYNRFGLSRPVAGAIFFWSGLLSGMSALFAVRLANRIGLIRTMVFTHLPANGFLILAAFMPNAPLAVGCLLLRSALSQMDVPARNSYVMAIVTPEERAAAASITNVPRSFMSALPPIATGWMLQHSNFGWPLLIGGVLKASYDLTLLALFRHVRPPEEITPRGR